MITDPTAKSSFLSEVNNAGTIVWGRFVNRRAIDDFRQDLARCKPGQVNDQSSARCDGGAVSNWIREIKKAWAKGPANTLELARLVSAARNGRPHGGWTALWRSCQMPFAKRKGYLLVAIGEGLGWANVHVCAHLPTALRTLCQLAKLDRTTLEGLIEQGLIHTALKESEARKLVAQLCGLTLKPRSVRAVLRERLNRFADFIDSHLAEWSADDRALATEELTRLLEQIGNPGGIERGDHSPPCLPQCDVLTD